MFKKKEVKKGDNPLADLFIEFREMNENSLKLLGKLIILHKAQTNLMTKIMIKLTEGFKEGIKERELKKKGKKNGKKKK